MVKEIDNKLINCAGNGDLEGVKEALKNGANVDSTEPQIGATALIAASICGNNDIIKLLLEKGAEVNAVDKNAFTPLMYSATSGNAGAVKLLLDKKADVDSISLVLETPLFRAAGNGHTEVVKLLLEKGADANAQSQEGSTALMLAADNGHTEIVKLLLEKGARKNIKHPYSYKIAYDYARRNGHSEIEELLKPEVEAAPTQIKKTTKKLSPKDQTAVNKQLIDAIWKKDMESVVTAIENGADANANVDGDYPIILATYNGCTEIVELLIKQGADVNVEDSGELRAISKACGGGFTDIVKLLLDNGAEVKKVYIVSNEKIAKLLEEAQKKSFAHNE